MDMHRPRIHHSERQGAFRARWSHGGSPWLPSRSLCPADQEYPAQLRSIPSPPDSLAVVGELLPGDALAVAVVGSRYPTPYGAAMAGRLAGELARRGVTVVSGLARGIDIAAHRGALGAGGRTIAVLGSGIDVLYPAEHEPDARAIARRGAVMSQFPAGMPPRPAHFPIRNRVIAGLSLGVVVVEAAERSGSLITARLAGDLGREVMAMPGRVTSRESRGAHQLIKDGAALVEGWDDVIAQLPDRWRACVGSAPTPPDDRSLAAPDGGDGERGRLLNLVAEDALGMDDLIDASGLAPARVAALLGTLEIEGQVRKLPGPRFLRSAGRARPMGEE
jgi:DNA processing protein